MPSCFFPDNTVLINFTHIDRQDLLKWFVRRNGCWTVSLARECAKSAQVRGLERMANWADILNKPIAPGPAELVDARVIAEQMRKPGETSSTTHMGEAETIAVIRRRQLKAVFLTDDHDAARAAVGASIDVACTTKIIALAEVMGQLSNAEARAHLAALCNLGRVLGNPPFIAEYDDYVARAKRSRHTQPPPGTNLRPPSR